MSDNYKAGDIVNEMITCDGVDYQVRYAREWQDYYGGGYILTLYRRYPNGVWRKVRGRGERSVYGGYTAVGFCDPRHPREQGRNLVSEYASIQPGNSETLAEKRKRRDEWENLRGAYLSGLKRKATPRKF